MNAEDTSGSADHRGGETPPPLEEDRAGVDYDLFCPECGYNLRGVTSDRCPECGVVFDRATLVVSRIPWVHRKELGWLRAYWGTVWFVSVHPRRFCQEAAHPVDFDDAQRFRWVTIAHVLVPLLLVGAYPVVRLLMSGTAPSGSVAVEFAIGKVTWAAATAAFFLAATGVPSYFFHPRHLPVSRQNRLVAMSYYTCAPLALTPPTMVVVVVVGINLLAAHPDGDAAIGFVAMLGLLKMGVWWFCLGSMTRPSVSGRQGRGLLVALGVPFLWFGLALVTLGGIPRVVGWVTLIIFSLR